MSQIAKKNSPPKLSLTVQYARGAQHLPTRAQIRRWIRIALQRDVNITLRIVDQPEGRELNSKYRGKDYATNVLTFVYDDARPRHGGVGPSDEAICHSPSRMARSSITNAPARGRPTGTPLLRSDPFPLSQPQPLSGDIVICAPVVEKEAREQRKDLLAHYAHLTIHAILHLQGYDHDSAADAAAMESRETAIMQKLGYADPYQGAVS